MPLLLAPLSPLLQGKAESWILRNLQQKTIPLLLDKYTLAHRLS